MAMNVKKIPNIIKKKIEIADKYLDLYPSLKRYEDITKELKFLDKGEERNLLLIEQSEIHDKFKYLKLYNVSNFLHEIKGESRKYLTGELIANSLEILEEIKDDIKDYLNQPEFNPKSDRYYHEDHKSALEMEELWSKVETKEDFLKIITGECDSFEYTTYGDFCPFHNTNKHRKAKIISVIIDENLSVDESSALDLDLHNLIKPLKEPNKEQAETDRNRYDLDQKIIEEAIKALLPLCEKAKEADGSWEHNFFNNKILRELKLRMKK